MNKPLNQFNLHLISDSSSEILKGITKFAISQFKNVHAKTCIWPLIRTEIELKNCLNSIKAKPGIILFMIKNENLRESIKNFCQKHRMPCIGILEKVIKEISAYLGIAATENNDSNFGMDKNYYDRMEAIEYTLKHDDGQQISTLGDADIIILGPSRTSKSPTSVYLAFNGIKVANIPLVPGIELPSVLKTLVSPLIIGFIIDSKRLIEVRSNRINVASENINYINYDMVVQECKEAKKIFMQNRWPMIDITLKSVEEISSDILSLYYERKQKVNLND